MRKKQVLLTYLLKEGRVDEHDGDGGLADATGAHHNQFDLDRHLVWTLLQYYNSK